MTVEVVLVISGTILVFLGIVGRKVRIEAKDIKLSGDEPLSHWQRFSLFFIGTALIVISIEPVQKQIFPSEFEPKPTSTFLPTNTLVSKPILTNTSDSILQTQTPELTIGATKTLTLKNTATETATPNPNSPEMVKVPAGNFTMGSSYYTSYDFDPAHEVYVSEFYIDKYEVTNSQYHDCVDDQVCEPPKGIGSNTRENYFDDLSKFGDYPVIYVTWHDASIYCEWRDVRLPTEAEWEKAARWNPATNEANLFPWGNEHPSHGWVNMHSDDTAKVGSFNNSSPVGAFDMAGNVLEWVNDYYDSDYYGISSKNDPRGPSTGSARVARGGSWISEEVYEIWTIERYFFQPDTTRSYLGFRCATK